MIGLTHLLLCGWKGNPPAWTGEKKLKQQIRTWGEDFRRSCATAVPLLRERGGFRTGSVAAVCVVSHLFGRTCSLHVKNDAEGDSCLAPLVLGTSIVFGSTAFGLAPVAKCHRSKYLTCVRPKPFSHESLLRAGTSEWPSHMI